jgi:transcriptional regulator with XRE-family HTH domain
MTLRELAKKSGTSIAHISEVERGLKEPSSEVLDDLCYALDITVCDVLIGAAGVIRGG